jgi:hypothetical protein
MRFENFWNEYSFFTDPVVRFSGKPTNIDFSFPIYRAREWNGFELIRENLQYPRENDCRRIGRANVPYHPVFYGSYSIDCAVKEIKTDKPIALSTWNWKEKLKINAHLLSTREKEYESALKEFNVNNNDDYQNRLIQLNRDFSSGTMHGEMLERMHGVAELFLNEEDYFGSAIIGFEELYRTRINKKYPSTDVLIYPSIRIKKGINLAIHPEVVDKFLVLKSIEIF